jgi:hypothetical protein
MADGQTPLTQAERDSMLAQLGKGLYPAATAGVKRTTLSQLLDPELLTAIGVISPDYLSQALQSYVDAETATQLSEALKDYDSKVAKVESKYRPPVFVSAADQNLRALAASDPNLADGLAGIQAGTIDADTFADNYANQLEENDPALAGVVRNNVKSYGRDWSRYQQDLLEFRTIDLPQYNQEIMELGDRPTAESLGITRESLKAQFAKDMGIPGLALLPDPGETYKIDPAEMRQFRKPTQAGTDMRLFESMLMSGAGRDIPRSATPRLTNVSAPKPRILEGDPMGRTVDTPGFGRGTEGVPPVQRPRPAGYVAPSLERDLARYAQQDYESLMVDAMLREQQMAAKGRTPFEDALRQAQIFARRTK